MLCRPQPLHYSGHTSLTLLRPHWLPCSTPDTLDMHLAQGLYTFAMLSAWNASPWIFMYLSLSPIRPFRFSSKYHLSTEIFSDHVINSHSSHAQPQSSSSCYPALFFTASHSTTWHIIHSLCFRLLVIHSSLESTAWGQGFLLIHCYDPTLSREQGT